MPSRSVKNKRRIERASNPHPEGTIVGLLSTWTQWCGIHLQHGPSERTQMRQGMSKVAFRRSRCQENIEEMSRSSPTHSHHLWEPSRTRCSRPSSARFPQMPWRILKQALLINLSSGASLVSTMPFTKETSMLKTWYQLRLTCDP